MGNGKYSQPRSPALHPCGFVSQGVSDQWVSKIHFQSWLQGPHLGLLPSARETSSVAKDHVICCSKREYQIYAPESHYMQIPHKSLGMPLLHHRGLKSSSGASVTSKDPTVPCSSSGRTQLTFYLLSESLTSVAGCSLSQASTH